MDGPESPQAKLGSLKHFPGDQCSADPKSQKRYVLPGVGGSEDDDMGPLSTAVSVSVHFCLCTPAKALTTSVAAQHNLVAAAATRTNLG